MLSSVNEHLGLWISVAILFGAFVVLLMSATEESRRRNRATRNIQRLISQDGTMLASDVKCFSVHDDVSGLIVHGESIQAVDLRDEGSLIHHLALSQIAALKIYEGKRGSTAFRLVTRNRAETRRIEPKGFVALTELARLLHGNGIPIEYVPEAK